MPSLTPSATRQSPLWDPAACATLPNRTQCIRASTPGRGRRLRQRDDCQRFVTPRDATEAATVRDGRGLRGRDDGPSRYPSSPLLGLGLGLMAGAVTVTVTPADGAELSWPHTATYWTVMLPGVADFTDTLVTFVPSCPLV